MSTANVAAMINHLVQRYGLDDTDSRALCLNWLQLSEEEVWNKGEWWFKREEASVAMVAGTKLYTVAAGPQGLDKLQLSDGTSLTELNWVWFRDAVGADVTAGTPRIWCALPPTAQGTLRFEVWPVPSANGAFLASQPRRAGTLADSAASKSLLPPDWRHLVLTRAEVYASAHAGQANQSQVFLGQYGEQLAALVEVNERRRRNGRA